MDSLHQGRTPMREVIGSNSGGGFEGVRVITGNDTVVRSDLEKVLKVTSDATLTFNDTSAKFVYIEAVGATVTLAASGSKSLAGQPLVFEDGTSVVVYLDQDGTTHRVMGSGEINTNSNAGSDSDGVGLVKAKEGSDTPIKRISISSTFGRILESSNSILIQGSGELLAEAQTYVDDTSMAGDPEAIDDLYAVMKGYADSASFRGTVWDQLSEDIYSKLITGHVFLADYNFGSGTSVRALKGSLHGTINGSMAWNADGFTFDGVNDDISLGAAAITGVAEWTFIAVVRKTAADGSRTIASQNTGGGGRIAFGFFDTDGSIASFHNDGTTSRVPKTAISEADADDRIIMTRWATATGYQVFKDTGVTAPGGQTIVAAPQSIQNSAFRYGSNGGGSGFYTDRMRMGFLFAGSIDVADKNKFRTALNNIFGLSIQS